jgi:hypothetical protein
VPRKEAWPEATIRQKFEESVASGQAAESPMSDAVAKVPIKCLMAGIAGLMPRNLTCHLIAFAPHASSTRYHVICSVTCGYIHLSRTCTVDALPLTRPHFYTLLPSHQIITRSPPSIAALSNP